MSLNLRDLKPFPAGAPSTLLASIGYTPHSTSHISFQIDHEVNETQSGGTFGPYGARFPVAATVTYTATTHYIPIVPLHYDRKMTLGLMIAGPELDRMAYCVWEAIASRMPPPRTIFTSYSRLDLAQPTFFYLFVHRLQQVIMGAVVTPVNSGDFDVNVYELGPESSDPKAVIRAMYALEKKHLDNVYDDLL